MADQPCPICDLPHDGAVTRLPPTLYAGLTAVLAKPPAPAPIYPTPRHDPPVGKAALPTVRTLVARWCREHYPATRVVPRADLLGLSELVYAGPDYVADCIALAGYRLATKREAL